jgi:hypothetical protein
VQGIGPALRPLTASSGSEPLILTPQTTQAWASKPPPEHRAGGAGRMKLNQREGFQASSTLPSTCLGAFRISQALSADSVWVRGPGLSTLPFLSLSIFAPQAPLLTRLLSPFLWCCAARHSLGVLPAMWRRSDVGPCAVTLAPHQSSTNLLCPDMGSHLVVAPLAAFAPGNDAGFHPFRSHSMFSRSAAIWPTQRW